MRKNLLLLAFTFCVVVNNAWAQRLELSTTTINACSQTTVQVCATTYEPDVINSAQQDDFFTDTVGLGFNFNYFGQQFSAIVISPNNMVSFDLALANLYSEWEYGSALNTGQLNKAIMFPFQDLHIGGAIKYKTVGTAPNRKFVIEFCQVPFYFCLANTTTNQLILHETSNIIEMHIAAKPYCAGWSGSTYASAIQGVKSGTNEVFVAGRGPNSGAWSVNAPEARRFSPNGTSYAVSNIAYSPVILIEPGNGNFQWFAGNSTTPFATTPCAGITTNQSINYYVVKYSGGNQSCNPIANGVITDTVYVNHDEVVETATLTFCRDQLPAQWRGITIPNTATTTNNYDSVWVNGINGGCDTNFILNIVVNDYQQAQFTPVGTICAGTTFSLPATSNNGINGSWSPAINNTATTTYTFTPNQGQCGLPVTMTVTVQPSDTPFFNQVNPICAGAALAPLPTTSLNGITGSWSPALNNNATTTYTFTPANSGACVISPTMTIVVAPVAIPTFNQVMPICSGGPLNPLPTTSLNGYTGTWSPAINSSVTTTYTFTPDPGQGCVSTTTMTINVNDINTTPAFVNPGAYCEGYQFTLPNISLNGIEGTWAPVYDYYNTTTYTFTPNPGQCGNTISMTIAIYPYIIPDFTQIPPVCLGSAIPPLPTTSNNGVTGIWSPALNNTSTTTYTFQPNYNFCANPVTMTVVIDSGATPMFSIVDSICHGTTVNPLPGTSLNGIAGTWIPAFNSTQTTTYTFTSSAQCAPAVTHTLSIFARTEPTFTQIIPVCQGETLSPFPTTSLNGITGTWSPAPNNMATTTYTFTPDTAFCATPATMTVVINSNGTVPVFDSIPNMCVGTNISPLPTTSLNGINGTWSPALSNIQTTTYTFTPVVNSCGIPTTLTINIDTLVIPSFNPVAPVCPGTNLSPLPLISDNGIKGNWSPALNNMATTTYTFTPLFGQCAVAATMTIEVDTAIAPVFAAVPAICEGATLNPLPTTSQNGITGAWSPALNNGATTTYIFTPDQGQCAAADSMTIVVHPNVSPLFTQVDTVCAGTTLNPLPATSNNGITGTWSPALNNTQTTTYTFTPAAGQCGLPATMTIQVNDGTLPSFTQVNTICAGGTLNALPTTSNNNITGTWSPALNNTATTTYTFTPNAGQCALNTTITIVVDTNVVPVFTAVAAICEGATLNPLPATSLNGVTGTWSPLLNNTQTTTYTFTPNQGQCATIANMTIVVDTALVPTFAAVATICEGGTLNPLPATSQNGITGSWSPALNNGATTTYTFIPNAGQCADSATLTITVIPNTIPQFTPVNAICAGTALNPLPTTSLNGVTGTWSPALNNTATTTYTFTPAAGQCATATTMTINVNDGTLPAFTQVGAVCAGGTLNALPTTSNNNINGTWSPALNNTATTTYTFTPATGQCALTTTMTIVVTPNVTPVFAPLAPICIGGTLNPLPATSQNGVTGTWSPALNNVQTTTYTFTPAAGQCATTVNMTITVDTAVVPVFAAVPAICEGAALNPLPLSSQNGITGTWSPALNNTATTTYTFIPAAGQCATPTTLTIPVTPNTVPQFTQVSAICAGATLNPLPATSLNGITGTWSPAVNNTATTTYTFTPTAGQCATTTTMTINVNNGTVPTFTQVSQVCAGALLNPLPTTSNNNITGTWSPALNNTATTTYTFTPNAGQCALTATMTIVVTPNVTPAFAPVAPVCTGGSLSPLPVTSQNGVTGTWSPALNNTQTTTYTFTPATGQCATTVNITITVDTAVVPTFTPVAGICQGAALNPLATTSNNGITGTWSPALNNNVTTTYTFTPAAGQCAAVTTLTITVTPNTVAQFTQVGPICTGGALNPLPATSLNGVTGTWSPALNNTATTTYTFTPTAGTGNCWTGTTMQIVVNPYLTGNRNVSICAGNSYMFNGTTYTSSVSGVKDTVSNLGSCDSIITLFLTVNPVTTGIQQATICAGDTYIFNGQSYTNSNSSAQDTLVNQYGCDSIVTLNLTVLPVNPVTDTVRLTDCGRVIYAGNNYTANTHLVDTIQNANGCDSIYKHVLITVNPVYTFKETVHIKGCKEVTYKGVTYDQSTVFEEEIKTVNGCDSLVNTVVIEINDFKLKAYMNPEAPFKGENVQILTYSVGNVPYSVVSWEPAILFPNQTATEQRVKLENPVRIVITGVQGGCKDTALIDITEFPGYSNEVKVPSAFSPNGDGLNDVFAPVLRIDHGYSLVSFKIYSRYGELVHSTSNMSGGWDGTYKGRLQDAGVYYYMIKIKFLDGTEKSFKGDVTLLK
ncbi:MAG: gliding motility-associated C-terminal domain-containing protein [Sphingobacteriales bacterium]|nr:MAG: gliding motility-associated C-terminal domain-containing protein [Sphingobacteriales bacterium]